MEPANELSQKKSDRRVSRTQNALRQALVELIAEKPYEAITVEEIAQRADVGRATFYLHYKDKEELLLDYFSGLIAGRIQQFAGFPLAWLREIPTQNEPASPLEVAARPIAGVFQHAAENAALYRLALKGEGASRIAEQLRTITVKALEEMLREKVRAAGLELRLQVPVELVAQSFVGAFLGCLTWWLENDLPYPPQEMARLFRMMFFPGVRTALGIE